MRVKFDYIRGEDLFERAQEIIRIFINSDWNFHSVFPWKKGIVMIFLKKDK